MIAIGTAKVENLFITYSKEINKIAVSALKKLKKRRFEHAHNFNSEELAYLDKVIDLYQDLNFIKSQPDVLKVVMAQFPELPSQTITKDTRTGDDLKMDLTDHILSAISYQYQRSTFYPEFFKELGIKACVYCNSQSTLSMRRYDYEDGTYKIQAKYQLDHYFAKGKYPFLGICFYNFYPVCGCCNNAKGTIDLDFDLYAEPKNPCDYYFELTRASISKYLLHQRRSDLEIVFHDPKKNGDSSVHIPGSFQDTFNIQGIYEQQQDLTEELIIKAQIYTKSYKEGLAAEFSRIISGKDLTNRMILGNYPNADEIHKRPMAKFTRDIAIQLGLILPEMPINKS